jgi:hypothetical protein
VVQFPQLPVYSLILILLQFSNVTRKKGRQADLLVDPVKDTAGDPNKKTFLTSQNTICNVIECLYIYGVVCF